jgi:hypothetical protein
VLANQFVYRHETRASHADREGAAVVRRGMECCVDPAITKSSVVF